MFLCHLLVKDVGCPKCSFYRKSHLNLGAETNGLKIMKMSHKCLKKCSHLAQTCNFDHVLNLKYTWRSLLHPVVCLFVLLLKQKEKKKKKREEIAKEFDLPERQAKMNVLVKAMDHAADVDGEPQYYCICRGTDSTRFMMWDH